MNPFLTSLQEQILNSELSEQAKQDLLKSLTIADKQWAITDFKLERTEKVKKTTTILLEETIEELEKKRKAVEVQNRELEIETALERVRSRSMSMQKSEELTYVIKVVYDQFIQLGIKIEHAGFTIDYKNHDDYHLWIADPFGVPEEIVIPYFDCIYYNQFNEAKKNGTEFFATLLSFEEKNVFYQKLFESIPQLPEESKAFYFNCAGLAVSTVLLDDVALYIENFSGTPYTEEENKTLIRIGKVFQQAYTRFLDLKKSESQARESQIEAALERVRSRTMAMQRSDELGEAAILMFQQVKNLGADLFASGFNIWNEDKSAATAWMAGENRIQPPFDTSSTEDVFRRIFEAEQKGETLFVEEMYGEVNQTHYRYMLSIPDFKKMTEQFDFQIPKHQVIHCAFFSQGYLMFISFEPVPEAHELFRRFAKVFEQTYTRFLDLKKAEALAKEALKQASLDRIRGQVASMRSAQDLEHITPLLWNEFGVLNIPFIRCGVFIMNEAESVVNVFLSSRDGESLGVLQLPFDMPGLTKNTVEHWYMKEVYKEHWNKQEFIAWMQTLIQVGQLHDMSSYQGSGDAPESLYLHFVPFKQGMLYVGSAEALHEEHIELIKTLASTFSIAYSRYEDFRLLEDAKNRIETTLHELKAAQSQLVQAEKMASLGELTAGIAHEIQNPLNFVNNFSEVNAEMITEAREAISAGNLEDAEELLVTVADNEKKILEHGKRADGIVKGMLQHSRASSGDKELTDINALADEYLKLAYHGYRAKEKGFNVTIDTDLDPSIGKIRVVPQDLGRVLLNLYNNAFYAVHEKVKTGEQDPKVSLSIKKQGNNILIKVEDNGKGIPAKIREKIFQPFFTTKPTGQGTGLGLSLSYDIIKAHGGEIRVDSIEGLGTSFTVQLPLV